MVDRQVTALVGHLGGHDHDLAPLHAAAHRIVELAAMILRQAAHAEGLDDEAVAAVQHEVDQLAGCAGDQLQPGALLVVVDTNRPESVESEEMLETCNRVAVIDHHRRGSCAMTSTWAMRRGRPAEMAPA